MTDDEVHNVFDNNPDAPTVPVTIFLGENRKVIGRASMVRTDKGTHVDLDFDTDDEELVGSFLGTSLSHFSVDDTGLSANADAITPPKSLSNHAHKPVQHRDGKPPWCKTCGLTAGYLKPKSRIPSITKEES